jgi:hypothetical protein
MSGLFEGEEDWELPNKAGTIIKNLSGLRVLEEPMSQRLSAIAVLCYSLGSELDGKERGGKGRRTA